MRTSSTRADLAVDGLDELRRVQLARHGPRELVQRGQLRELPPVVLEQAGVLERDPGLARHRVHQPELPVAARQLPLPPDDDDRADQPLVRDDRREELGPVRREGHQLRREPRRRAARPSTVTAARRAIASA